MHPEITFFLRPADARGVRPRGFALYRPKKIGLEIKLKPHPVVHVDDDADAEADVYTDADADAEITVNSVSDSHFSAISRWVL